MFRTFGEQLRKPSGRLGKLVARMMDQRNKASYEKIIVDLELKFGDRIYEIGYGPGLGIELIANSLVGCTIHGTDFSELMYQESTKRNKKFIDEGMVQLNYGDFLTAKIANEKYDKVFCVNVVYFWSDLTKVFRKIYSMLDQEGIFCLFMTPDKVIARQRFAAEFFKHSILNVEAALIKAGFKNVEYILDKGYYVKARKIT